MYRRYVGPERGGTSVDNEEARHEQELVVRCECGFEVRGPEDELVPAVQEHGREAHNMDPTREQVLAMARPA